ncbi:hypothetical protein ABEB22_10885 [Thioclava sp. 'Guangxiensis']|uniref:hypothetical protein n=1 Tax=Thioclava sp. 'Guangxiensis' TaxID=3149044 RepID=UPI00387804DF
MTTLVAWVSYQNRKPSCLNIASDSRFSWGSDAIHWDCGRKIFWSKNGSEIFGYAGDVVSQSNMLSQLCELVDYSTIIATEGDAETRHSIFLDLLKSAYAAQVGTQRRRMVTFHGTRQILMKAPQDEEILPREYVTFRLWRTCYEPTKDIWLDKEHKFPEIIDDRNIDRNIFPQLALAAGSGGAIFRAERDKNFRKYGYTSRAVFAALMCAIGKDGDKLSGGPAQAVTLGLTGTPKPIGFVIDGERSVAGMRLGDLGAGGEIEWRNSSFEYLDKVNLTLAPGASRHIYW